ncbi:MAG: DUF559 domain-containing protein [Pseudomonadota bacterium]
MNLRASAKSLRRRMTDPERLLWFRLRAHRLHGHKFKRQHPLGPYILDFVSMENYLVIEVDGGQHADTTNDVVRDRWLAPRGFNVLRFWNNEVLQNTDGVLEVIAAALRAPSLPSSLPAGERGVNSPRPEGERGLGRGP